MENRLSYPQLSVLDRKQQELWRKLRGSQNTLRLLVDPGSLRQVPMRKFPVAGWK